MINKMKKITLVILILVIVNCENKTNNYLIKEGYGVNNFRLGIKKNKLPKEINGITPLLNRDSLVYAIDIKSDAFHTKDEIKVGVKYDFILEKRGMHDDTKTIEKANPTNKKNKFSSIMHYDGIIFFLDDEGVVEKIRIY